MEKLASDEIKMRMKKTLADLRVKYNTLVQTKANLQEELIRIEEDKLEISKALVELQIENTRLLEMISNKKFEFNEERLPGETEIVAAKMKTEQVKQALKELQKRFKEIIEEKKDVEMEFICLKKNYMKTTKEMKSVKHMRGQLELEMVNLQNANQQLNKDQD